MSCESFSAEAQRRRSRSLPSAGAGPGGSGTICFLCSRSPGGPRVSCSPQQPLGCSALLLRGQLGQTPPASPGISQPGERLCLISADQPCEGCGWVFSLLNGGERAICAQKSFKARQEGQSWLCCLSKSRTTAPLRAAGQNRAAPDAGRCRYLGAEWASLPVHCSVRLPPHKGFDSHGLWGAVSCCKHTRLQMVTI